MDTLCGIGLPELIILALLGFVVIGPQRSQEVALKAGRLLRQAMTSAWWREFNQVAQALRDLPTTLVRMAEIEDAQAELRRTVSEIEQEARLDLRPTGPAGRPTLPTDAVTDPWGIRNAAAGTRIMKPDKTPDNPDLPAPAESSGDEATGG